jgi:hypothetical protein
MSPVDPRELKGAKRTFVETIDSDRLCGNCGYNLRGLPYNGKCPECGRPISARGRRGFKRFSDNLTDAPMFYLRTLAIGTWMLAAAGVGLSLCLWYAGYTWRIEWAIGAGVASLAWWMGVYIVTAKRSLGENTLRDELLDGPWLTRVNRVVHVAWILAAGAWVIATKVPSTPTGQMARNAGHVLEGVGTLGFIPLALQLSAFADWAQDTSLSERFKIAAWTMAIAGIFAVAGFVSTRLSVRGMAVGPLGIAVIVAYTVLSLAKLVFIWGLLQLAHVSFWAVSNSATASETERRLAAKREEHTQEMADRAAIAVALQDPAPQAAADRSAPAPTPFETNRIAKNAAANPYDLEPES